jgi:hypothetical protein
MRHSITLVAVLLVIVGSASAQDPVTAVKDLYESAAYEDALSAIDRLSNGASTEQPTKELRKYRALCLLALERTADAEEVIQELIVNDPQYRPDAQASPRWVNAVVRVHSKVVPGLVRTRYASGKRHFDQKEFAPAAADFEMALTFLHNPILESSVVESLSDVATLSEGFLDLSRAALNAATSTPAKAAAAKTTPESAAAAKAAPGSAAAAKVAPESVAAAKVAPENAAAAKAGPENAAAVQTVPEKAVVQSNNAPGNTPASAAPGRIALQNAPSPNVVSTTGSAANVAARGPAIYTAADASIIQPVVLRQDLPPWRTGVRGNFVGQLDVLISETGDVQSAELRTPVHPLYNSVLVEAARRWQYKPAMKDGTPVKFLKTMIVNLGAN